jgi:multiple sugar transport system substrate-binding protein
MKHSRIALLLFSLLVLLLVASCGQKNSDTTLKTHIKLVHFYVDQKDAWQHDVVDAFVKSHPGIDVEVEAIPFGLYTTKIQAAAASGSTLGDVVVIDDWFGQELFKQNYTIALDSLFARDLKADDFYTQFFTVWRKGNMATAPLMAMPACGGVTALFYNKDIFDKAGLAYPDTNWTYADFLAAAQKLTNNATTPADKTWGFIMDDGLSTGIDTYIYSNGGKVISDDHTHGAMLEPASVRAMQAYVDLVQKYHVAPAPDPSQSMGQKFMLGHYAMMLNFDGSKLELAHAKFRWDLTAPPHGEAGLVDRQNGQAFGITTTSAHPTEAWELIKFIVTLPTKHGINELFSTAMPLYKPLAASPDFLDGEPRCNRRGLISINSGHVFTMITPGWQEWRDHGFIPNVQDILAGRKSVHDGLASIDAKINEVLKRTAVK